MKAGETCPSCGYSLAGLTGEGCPECGMLLAAMEHARGAFARKAERAVLAAVLVSAQFGMVTLGSWTAAAEPFTNLVEYAIMAIYLSFIAGVIAFLPAIGLALLVAKLATERAVRWMTVACAFALLPSMTYMFAVCARGVRNPGFGLPYQAKPAWIQAGVLDWLAFPAMLLLMWTVAIVAAFAVMKLREPLEKPRQVRRGPGSVG